MDTNDLETEPTNKRRKKKEQAVVVWVVFQFKICVDKSIPLKWEIEKKSKRR